MEANFATRLKLFMDHINVPSSQFADLCKIPRPSFSQLLSNRNQKVSDVLVRKIHSVYPELSIMWLMFGEGSMLTSESKKANSEEHVISSGTLKLTENDYDEPDSPVNGQIMTGYSNVKGLSKGESPNNSVIYQQLEESKKILELQMQIENLQKNPRRVTQITVYYDDSTFETFVPAK